MSLEDQTTGGDYTAPQPARRRISPARKALIAVMAIGAFAATAGAGTFASFTASTDNGTPTGQDNPFATPDFELTNEVIARSGSQVFDPECVSSDDLNEEFDAADPLFGTDNTAFCDVLFHADNYATTATADIRLENSGSSDGDLVFYAGDVAHFGTTPLVPEACVIDASLTATMPTQTSLCGDWVLTIQEYAVGGTPLSGAGAPAVNGGNAVADCVFPAALAACAATSDEFENLPLFTDTPKDLGSFPAPDSGADDNEDERYFRVTAQLPADPGCTDTTPVDGLDDVTGIGCHNDKMNGSAVIQLRWVLQG